MSDSHPATPESEIPEAKAPPPKRRVVRILSSELDVELREGLHAFVREAVGNEVWLETLLPENTLDGEILRTAIEHHWDLALLIIDNIKYLGSDRSAAVTLAGATKLLRSLRQTSRRPLLCFYDQLDDEGVSKALLAAGADGVFRLPCRSKDVVPTMKRCLERFVPKQPEPPPLPKPQSPSGTSPLPDDDDEDLEEVPAPIIAPAPKRDPLGTSQPKPPAPKSPPPKKPAPKVSQDDSGPKKPLVKLPWKLDLD
jgi:hypothetical protein